MHSYAAKLQKIVSKSGSGKTKYIDTIFDEPISSKSPASGILLRKQLSDQEFDDLKSILSDEIVGSFKKNKKGSKVDKFKITLNNLKFLKDKAKEGDLYCEYCNKGPLVIYDFNPDNIDWVQINNPKFRFNTKFNEKDGATCDHREPVSKGGDKFDYSNLAVSCYPCNKRKGNMNWQEWKRLMKINEAIEDSDLEDIRDIFSDLNDDYGLETLVVKVNTKDDIMIKTDGMLKKDNFFNTIENLTKDLNNIYKRLNYFSREIDISNFDIRDYIFDGDGEPLTLKDKFHFYMIIYLYI